MIEIRNSQLTNDTVAVLNKIISMDINASGALKLARILKELSSILDTKIELEKKILNKYATKGEDGSYETAKNDQGDNIPGSIKISNMEEFNVEMSAFINDTNKISLDKVKFETLGLDNSKFTTKDMIKIEFLFE